MARGTYGMEEHRQAMNLLGLREKIEGPLHLQGQLEDLRTWARLCTHVRSSE